MESISWLEGFLSAYQGSVIIVSHDRYFLDKIVTKVVELDNGESHVYNGNYSYYAEKRFEIRANMMRPTLTSRPRSNIRKRLSQSLNSLIVRNPSSVPRAAKKPLIR